MKASVLMGWALVAICAAPAGAAPGSTLSPASRDLARALTHGNCQTAVSLANEDMKSSDPQAIFLIGRMVAEGVCVQKDVAAATPYFSHAAAQGLAAAEIEVGVQTGLGEGVEQSYERAGDHCQKGTLEHSGDAVSLYSLGYACTVRGLVSRRLRESLPRGAFVANTGVAQLSFNPRTGAMRIRATPRVASKEDSTTGSFLHVPVFDAAGTIDKAWRDALGAVPKPDAARLDDQGIALTLDLDMTIEGATGARGSAERLPDGALLPGDVHAATSISH